MVRHQRDNDIRNSRTYLDEYDGKHVFVITPKGTQYLEQYKKFANVAESFGLEM